MSALAGHDLPNDPRGMYVVEEPDGRQTTYRSHWETNAMLDVACRFLEGRVGVLVNEGFRGHLHPEPLPHAVFAYGPLTFTVWRKSDAERLFDADQLAGGVGFKTARVS